MTRVERWCDEYPRLSIAALLLFLLGLLVIGGLLDSAP